MSSRPTSDREEAQSERNPSPGKAPRSSSCKGERKAEPNEDEVAVTLFSDPAPIQVKCSLLDELNAIGNVAKKVATSATERSQEMSHSMERQRRKSRELEKASFGCLLSEMNNLRAAFDSVDIDKSGEIDCDELQKALGKAGKRVSQSECKKMIHKVDLNGDGLLSFEEFRMIFTEETPPAFRADKHHPILRDSSAGSGGPSGATNSTESLQCKASIGNLKYDLEKGALSYSFTPRGDSPVLAGV